AEDRFSTVPTGHTRTAVAPAEAKHRAQGSGDGPGAWKCVQFHQYPPAQRRFPAARRNVRKGLPLLAGRDPASNKLLPRMATCHAIVAWTMMGQTEQRTSGVENDYEHCAISA